MARGPRQVALLRGINVGRSKRIGMARLRELLERLGYLDVRTHLQSGNAILTSPQAASSVARAIERAIAEELDLDVRVVVRSAAELDAVVAGNPLSDVATDPAKYLVGFLGSKPNAAAAGELEHEDFTPDRVHLVGRELYLWCPNGVLDSPFSRVDWDKRLGVPVTMRNWKTVTKLAELCGG